MRTKELAEIYAEVDDFLENELDNFLHFLVSNHYISDLLTNNSWKTVIRNYLENKPHSKQFNPSERISK